MIKSQWYLLETEQDYEAAIHQYELLKHSVKGSNEHKEKMLLVHLIADYEKNTVKLPEVDPIELIHIRMSDFGYKPVDLAKAYGDKGTVSKVLNYKQSLSLNMIRKFSDLLRIPIQALVRDYQLKDTTS